MNSAYIETVPDEIVFVLKYDDGSEDMKIEYKKEQLYILQGNDRTIVSYNAIDWLRQALLDVKNIIKMDK